MFVGLKKESLILLKVIERSETESVMLIKVLGLLHPIFLESSEKVSVIKALSLGRSEKESVMMFWLTF